MPTMTGRSNTWLFGAILMTGFADMDASVRNDVAANLSRAAAPYRHRYPEWRLLHRHARA